MNLLENHCDICGEFHWTSERLRTIEEFAYNAQDKSMYFENRALFSKIIALERKLGFRAISPT